MLIIKKLQFILLSLLVININAQALDEQFLNSLPDDIKKDLSEKNSQQEANAQENYRPYLYSSKLSKEEELLSLKDRLELDLLELNRRLNNDESIVIKKDLELYGSDFFNTFQTTFMPTNEPNPDSGYILDVGDILKIQLVGQKNYVQFFPVSRDGSVSLPDIGKIVVAGLTLDNSSKLIKSKVNLSFIGTEAFVSLSEIRDVNILVTGNAENPGVYTLTGNSNLLHALSAAGGISEFGSYREINLVRNNLIVETLDVYDLLINGQYNLNKRLRSGDVVFVEARKKIVTIDGAVNRPAKYEVLSEQNLETIIQYANGIKRTADPENFSLERVLDGTLKTIKVANKSQFKTIKAEDGDLIYIREYPYRNADITGAVLKPGSYTMAPGETISDLIKKAGGYTENAYQFGAVYQNEDAKAINIKSKQVLYEEFLDNIIALSQQNVSSVDLTPIVTLTEKIKNTDPNGRIVIDLLNDSSLNLYPIKEGDELFIPEKNNVVYVYGETSSEGAVMYVQNEDVNYFVNKSGGFKKFADKKSIYILHPNGESQLYSSKRNIFESSPKSQMVIYPGSVIFVPKELDDSTSKRIATQAYVSILGNLGIALASLSSINNN
jgi:protein involved in polysaccharide export with SLBB domain